MPSASTFGISSSSLPSKGKIKVLKLGILKVGEEYTYFIIIQRYYMKFLQGYLAGFMAAALAWSLPQPPRQRPAPHPQALQNSEYQTHTGSSEYVPSEFEHMSLYHGNTASSNPPVVHGYEHLLPHFNVEMNSDEVHQTEHYGLMPDPYLYEHFTRQQEAGFA